MFGDLSTHVGWKHQDLVERLEPQRRVKSGSYFLKKKASMKARREAVKGAKVSKEDQKLLENAGLARSA